MRALFDAGHLEQLHPAREGSGGTSGIPAPTVRPRIYAGKVKTGARWEGLGVLQPLWALSEKYHFTC